MGINISSSISTSIFLELKGVLPSFSTWEISLSLVTAAFLACATILPCSLTSILSLLKITSKGLFFLAITLIWIGTFLVILSKLVINLWLVVKDTVSKEVRPILLSSIIFCIALPLDINLPFIS